MILSVIGVTYKLIYICFTVWKDVRYKIKLLMEEGRKKKKNCCSPQSLCYQKKED